MGLTISPEASAHSQAHSGDVSALCLLRVPDAVSGIERTVVLAGIGSQLLAYDLCSGQLLFCHRVMPDGMHLHGIAAERPASGGWDALLALHGDRHACVASLHLRDAPRAEVLWALPALRSQASVIVVFDSRVTMNCDTSSSSGATNSSYMFAGLSITRVRVFDSISSLSTHGRGACVAHFAP